MPIVRPTRNVARRAAGALAVAGLLALVAAGCTAAPSPTAAPTPSADAADPIFASDEEALAAAQRAYTQHLAIVDQLTQDPESDASLLQDVATEGYSISLSASLQRLRDSGNRTQGSTGFDRMGLVEQFESDDLAHVSVYLCLDVSGVRVVDPSGADVTPSDRVERAPLQVSLESAGALSNELLVSGAEPWSGNDFCS